MGDNPLTYQDYLRHIRQFAGSEGGSNGPALDELQWNALSPEQRWANVGGSISIDRGDPRYERLARMVGGEPGRTITLVGGNTPEGVDASRVKRGEGFFAYSEDMRTPESQAQDSFSDAQRAAALLFPVAAGMGINAAYGAGALGGAGAEAAGAGGLSLSGSGTAGIGAGASGGAAFTGAEFGAGGLAGLGASSGGGAGGASIPADLPLSSGAGSGAGSALDAAPAIRPQTSGGLLNNLGGAGNVARGVLGLASLGAAGSGGGNSNGQPTDANTIIEQMANANRVNHNTPLGSRNWSQGADGRWTVNDTMNPTEAANFQTVQGINSNVSNATRDRLAAFLAQPPRQRYDRPLGS